MKKYKIALIVGSLRKESYNLKQQKHSSPLHRNRYRLKF